MKNDYSKLEARHFENGKNFEPKLFQSYKTALIEMTEATRTGAKKMWTVLGIMSGVVALFVLVLRLVDGDGFLSALSTAIFSGIFLGMIFLLPPIYVITYLVKFRKPVKNYREKMQYLGINNKDFKTACKNMKSDSGKNAAI